MILDFRKERKQKQTLKNEAEIWTSESRKINTLYALSNKIQYMLRNGYQLTISSDRLKDKCNAFLALKYTGNPLDNFEEVDINSLLSPDSSIKDYLTDGTAVIIVFNGKEAVFEGFVVRKLTEGPYCENCGSEEVAETRVKANSFKECLKKMEDRLLVIDKASGKGLVLRK